MIPRTMIVIESSVQLPSQHPVIKVMTVENLKVHTELSVQAAVLGLSAVLGTQPRVTCLGQCFTT
jgi:hypothetical protein